MDNTADKLTDRILAKVLTTLADDLAGHDGIAFTLEKIRVEVVSGDENFVADVALDAEYGDGAVVTVGRSFVNKLRRTVAMLETGLNFDVTEDETGELVVHPLLEFGLRWIILHEAAHWACGHLNDGGSPIEGLKLLAVENVFGGVDLREGPRITPLAYKCMELEADFVATRTLDWLYADEWLTDGANPHPELVNADRGDMTTMSDTRRILALASSIIILTIESIRKRARAGMTHPSPEARAFNVMSALIGQALIVEGEVIAGEVRVRPRDDAHIARIGHAIRELASLFCVDLVPFASTIGVEPIFGWPDPAQFTDAEGKVMTATTTTHDLMLLLLNSNVSAEQMRTPGAREYIELRTERAQGRVQTPLSPPQGDFSR